MKILLQGIVGFLSLDQAQALQQAAGVAVDDEEGLVEGIQQHVVGGFRAYTVEIQQLPAQALSVALSQRVESSLLSVPIGKFRQAAGLLVVVAGTANGFGEFVARDLAERIGVQKVSFAQSGQGLFDIAPGRVLGQDGADHDLEGTIRRPPGLLAVMIAQPQENLLSIQGFSGGGHDPCVCLCPILFSSRPSAGSRGQDRHTAA